MLHCMLNPEAWLSQSDVLAMEPRKLKTIVEAALLAAGRPLSVDQLEKLFDPQRDSVSREAIRACLITLEGDLQLRGYELKQVASGYRLQVRRELEPWISRLWEEKPSRYSQALLETLALIVHRQPITRAEIEDIRGVGVSSGTIKTLLERGWVRVLGHKDVPGRPALYGSTKAFLDYFNLKSLDELPNLADLKDLDAMQKQLDLESSEDQPRAGQAETNTEENQAVIPPDPKGPVIVKLPNRDSVH